MADLDRAVEFLQTANNKSFQFLVHEAASACCTLLRLEGTSEQDVCEVRLAATACYRVWVAAQPNGITEAHRHLLLKSVGQLFATRHTVSRCVEQQQLYCRATLPEKLKMLKQPERESVVRQLRDRGNSALTVSRQGIRSKREPERTHGPTDSGLRLLYEVQTLLAKLIVLAMDEDRCLLSAMDMPIPKTVDPEACWRSWGLFQKDFAGEPPSVPPTETQTGPITKSEQSGARAMAEPGRVKTDGMAGGIPIDQRTDAMTATEAARRKGYTTTKSNTDAGRKQIERDIANDVLRAERVNGKSKKWWFDKRQF